MENNPNNNTYDRRNEYNQSRNELVDVHSGSSSNIKHGKNKESKREINLSNLDGVEEINLNEQKKYQNLPYFY